MDWSMSVLLSPWWGSRQWAKMNKQRRRCVDPCKSNHYESGRTQGIGYLTEWKWVGEKIGSSFELPFPRCLRCLMVIIRCAFGAHLDKGLAERSTPCGFVGIMHASFPRLREDIRINSVYSHTYAHAHANTHARMHAHAHARTQARTHTHTHTHTLTFCVCSCVSTRERESVCVRLRKPV